MFLGCNRLYSNTNLMDRHFSKHIAVFGGVICPLYKNLYIKFAYLLQQNITSITIYLYKSFNLLSNWRKLLFIDFIQYIVLIFRLLQMMLAVIFVVALLLANGKFILVLYSSLLQFCI